MLFTAIKNGLFSFILFIVFGFVPRLECLGRADILEILHPSVADINQRYLSEAVTVLHYAAQVGQADAIGYFVSMGADVHANTSNGDTPLFSALKSRRSNIVKLLLDLGAKVDHRNVSGVTALHIAARLGEVESMHYLLQYGADPNATTPPDLRTPLLMCNYSNTYCCCSSVALLLANGADPNMHPSRLSASALNSALSRSCEICVRALLEYGADNRPLLQAELPPYLHRVIHEFKKVRLA